MRPLFLFFDLLEMEFFFLILAQQSFRASSTHYSDEFDPINERVDFLAAFSSTSLLTMLILFRAHLVTIDRLSFVGYFLNFPFVCVCV